MCPQRLFLIAFAVLCVAPGTSSSLLRANTIEGMFCDPAHGGNVDMVGWQLIGFPGPRMSNVEDVDKHFGEAFRPKPISLTQASGSKIRTAINGQLCVDLDDPKISRRGIIGLQMHAGGPLEVRFKDLQLELNPKFELITAKQ